MKQVITVLFLAIFFTSVSATLSVGFSPAEYEARLDQIEFTVNFSWDSADNITGFVVPMPPCKPNQPAEDCHNRYYTNVQVLSNSPDASTSTSGCFYYIGTNVYNQKKIICNVYGSDTSLALRFRVDNADELNSKRTRQKIAQWSIGVAGTYTPSEVNKYVTILWPDVKITSPADSSTVNENVEVSSAQSGSATPDFVKYTVTRDSDSTVIAQASSTYGQPFAWDTSKTGNGKYTIKAAGAWNGPIEGWPDTIRVVVENQEKTSPAQTPTPSPNPTPQPTSTQEPSPTPEKPNHPPVIYTVYVSPSATIEEDSIASFNVSYSEPDNDEVYIKWDFGDGHSSNLKKTTHYFSLPSNKEKKTFTVSVTVTDARGLSATKQKEVTVKKKHFVVSVVEPKGPLEKGTALSIKLRLAPSGKKDEAVKAVSNAVLEIGNQKVSLKKDSKGLLSGTLSAGYDLKTREDAILTSEVFENSRWKKVKLHFFIPFKPARISAKTPLPGFPLYPDYYLGEIKTTLFLPNGALIEQGNFSVEVQGSTSKKAVLEKSGGKFVAHPEYLVSKEDINTGLELVFSGKDIYGNELTQRITVPLSENERILSMKTDPELKELAKLNYGQPIRLRVKLSSPKLETLKKISLKGFVGGNTVQFKKKTVDTFEGTLVMPGAWELQRIVKIKLLAEADLNGKKLSVMKKQETLLSKRLRLKLLPLRGETVKEISAEITYSNGEPFSKNSTDALLKIDGKEYKLKLEKSDGNLFKGALAEPINPNGKEVELKIEGEYSATSSIKPKKEKAGVLWGWLVALMAGTALVGFTAYILRTVSKTPKPPISIPEKKWWEKPLGKTGKIAIKEVDTLKNTVKKTAKTQEKKALGLKNELKRVRREERTRKPKIRIVEASGEKQKPKSAPTETKKPVIKTGALEKEREQKKPKKPRIRIVEAKKP